MEPVVSPRKAELYASTFRRMVRRGARGHISKLLAKTRPEDVARQLPGLTPSEQAEVFRISPVEPWRIVRTRLRVAKKVPGPVEGGGRAAGYFTGSTGVTIYRGDRLPTEFRGNSFTCEPTGNLVHRDVLQPRGVTFTSRPGREGVEFLATKDEWFRPVNLANGPDGALYVVGAYAGRTDLDPASADATAHNARRDKPPPPRRMNAFLARYEADGSFTWVRGLWAGDTAVGLIAMVDLHPDHPDLTADDPKNAAYLWRLMIDKAHQGKGYGRDAMQIAFRQARAWGRDTFCVDVADREDSALGFYRRFGLEPTDRVVHGERMLIGPVPNP